jgi:hypothetical protein
MIYNREHKIQIKIRNKIFLLIFDRKKIIKNIIKIRHVRMNRIHFLNKNDGKLFYNRLISQVNIMM